MTDVDEALEAAERNREHSFARRFGVSWKYNEATEKWECEKESTGSVEDEKLDAARRHSQRALVVVKRIAKKIPKAFKVGGYNPPPQAAPFFIGRGTELLRNGVWLPMLQWLGEHARLEVDKVFVATRSRESSFARYDDEIAALNAYYASSGTSNVSATHRAAESYRIGLVGHGSGANKGAPSDETELLMQARRYLLGTDPWSVAVGEALGKIVDVELLRLTYVRLDGHRKYLKSQDGSKRRIVAAGDEDEEIAGYLHPRSALKVAHQVRTGTGPLPSGSLLSASARVTPALLVAEAIGALTRSRSPDGEPRYVSEEEQIRIASEIHDRTTLARARLKNLLEAVDLGEEVFPSYVIPRPDRQTLEARARRGPRKDVDACGGFVIIAGVKSPCRVVPVNGPALLHPTEDWQTCDYCARPVVPSRRAKP